MPASRALCALFSAKLVGIGSFGTQLAEVGPVAIHAGRASDAGPVSDLPAGRTQARRLCLLDGRAVGDEAIDLPVDAAR